MPHLLAGEARPLHGRVRRRHRQQCGSARTRFAGSTQVRLLYGQTYQFRTRLSDLSGGGPTPADNPIDEAVAQRTEITFQRWVPPKGLRVTTVGDTPHTGMEIDRIEVVRPSIGYPEATFTPRYGADPTVAATTVNAMLAQLGIAPDGTLPGAPPPANPAVTIGVPDPDVDALGIVVEVRALAHDAADDVSSDGAFQFLYATSRPVPVLPPLPANPTPADVVADAPVPPLELSYVDIDDVTGLVAPPAGPLLLPRSHDVRILITPTASGPTGYLGPSQPARRRSTSRAASRRTSWSVRRRRRRTISSHRWPTAARAWRRSSSSPTRPATRWRRS